MSSAGSITTAPKFTVFAGMSIEYTCSAPSSIAVFSRPKRPRIAERLGRVAVDAREIGAAPRVTCLERLERRDLGGREGGSDHLEAVWDPPRDSVSRQHDESVLVAGRRSRGRVGDHLERRLAAWRHRDRRRGRDRHSGACRLRLNRHLPGTGAAAGIGDRQEQRPRCPARDDVQVAERERLRIGEDEWRVGGRKIREPGALDRDRRLDRPGGVRPGRTGRGHQRRLHLARRPGRVPLEKQRDRPGDVWRREARSVENGVLVACELRHRRRDDLRTRR